LYGGCYARVSFTTYAYDSQCYQGVSFGLRAVQKAKDGERFGGAKASAQEFDELKEDF